MRSDIGVIPESDCIRVPGLRMDTISTVIQSAWVMQQPVGKEVARQSLKWEAACLPVAQQTYQMPHGVPEEYWRASIATKLPTGLPCTGDLRNEYLAVKHYLQEVTRSELSRGTGDALAAMLSFITWRAVVEVILQRMTVGSDLARWTAYQGTSFASFSLARPLIFFDLTPLVRRTSSSANAMSTD